MQTTIAVVGCTAAGKSDLAEALARRFADSHGIAATIMAVDSMQVYRGMDIGTAKPDAATRVALPHAMIDVADAWESYSAARFAAEAGPILREHQAAGKPIVLVAGTILYLRALLEGLFEGPAADPAIRAALEQEAAAIGAPGLHRRLVAVDPLAAGRIHPNDLRRIVRALEVFTLTGTPISALQTQWKQQRPVMSTVTLGVARPTESLNRRINARVKTRMSAGLLEEVRSIAAAPRGLSREAAGAVGYAQLLDHLAGRCTLDDAIERIKIQTRHLAKLQRTWLRRFEGVRWIDADENQSAADLIDCAWQTIAVS